MKTTKRAVLYYSPAATLGSLECNKGIEKVLKHLEDFRRQGIDLQVVDTTTMPDHGRQSEYMRAVLPSVLKKYRVRPVFGSRRNAGFMFGRGVPALVVYGPSSTAPEDVFPHEESGRIVTINESLSRLSAV